MPSKIQLNHQDIKRVLIPGIIGNTLEWYDFSLYAFFATIISQLFFPSQNKSISLITSFGVFAAGFLIRPLGAILFGHLGDKWGRKKTLILTVSLMAIATTAMGLIPTYASFGIYAAILFTLCRLLQGLALGGEAGYSIYLVELSPPGRRGFFGSWAIFSANGGFLIGSAVVAAVSGFFTETELNTWAWRIPFLFGSILGMISIYFRLCFPETPKFVELINTNNVLLNPIIHAVKQERGFMLTCIGLAIMPFISFYLLFAYLPAYMTLYLKLNLHESVLVNTISIILMMIVTPIVGYWSDHIGRKPLLIIAALLFTLCSYPLFLLLLKGSFLTLILVQCFFALVVCFATSTMLVYFIEMLPTNVRYSALALPYNFAGALFGGTAPLISTYLIQTTGNVAAPCFYLIAIGIATLCLLCRTPETFRLALR